MTATTETAWRTGSHGELTDETVAQLDGWWRAANYLSVGQIYLLNNPLLRTPLSRDDVNPDYSGTGEPHRTELSTRTLNGPYPTAASPPSTSPARPRRPWTGGQCLPRRHLHGRPIPTSPRTSRACGGCSASSPPRWHSSHVAPETPGSIHEGGELGYALPRLRRRVRQPRPADRRGRRRRRSGNRGTGHQLALQQVHQSRQRRRGAAHPSPSTATRSPTRPCWTASRRRSCVR